MKTTALLLAALLWAQAAQAGAEGRTLSVKALNGRYTYAQSLPCAEGKSADFSGRPKMRGGGQARDLILKSMLSTGADGSLLLDYDLTVAGERGIRAPFQAAGKVPLRPGKAVLAAEAGGWKLVLELQGEDDEERPAARPGRLKAALKCGRRSHSAEFVYLPEKQYAVTLYGGDDDKVEKFMLGLLPGAPVLDGSFNLQYTLLLKEGGETLAEGQGAFIFEPGASRSAAAGKGCTVTVKALR